MNWQRIEIYNPNDVLFKSIPKRFSRDLGEQPRDLKIYRVYWVSPELPKIALSEVFCDPVTEKIFFEPESLDLNVQIQIEYLPGVTDNVAHSAQDAFALLGYENVRVATGIKIAFQSDIKKQKLKDFFIEYYANPLIQNLHFLEKGVNFAPQEVKIPSTSEMQYFSLEISDDDLLKLSKERLLALSLEEMKCIQAEFAKPEVKAARREKGIGEQITDVELEVLAQTWSEHCKHKIFAANVEYTEVNSDKNLGKKKIQSLYKTYIQKATRDLQAKGKADDLVSVFSDNAGIVRYDEKNQYCIKVETHNSPSALDPYGGALTGILGVNRDILGTGIGAKPIANIDVFCLSLPRYFPNAEQAERPIGLKDPEVILEGVHQGVEDGGNKSGIPTLNGSFCFRSNYSGKPLIYVGSVGVMPQTIEGRETHKKEILAGHKAVVAGGRLGKDGIHGATFSSMELDEGAPAGVVQIGDPITQKRLLDFTLAARDQNLIAGITDNGAGGVSSSLGEMAEHSGGIRFDIAKHPLKYLGLAFYEKVISESQERMSYAISPEKIDAFLALAAEYDVEATVLGEFTDHGYFEVWHEDQIIAYLPLDFMHNALPKMNLKAHWKGSREQIDWFTKEKKQAATDLASSLKTLLARPNIASKEKWVRRYDHEVQGASHIKNFVGSNHRGPSDAAVIDCRLHGGRGGVSIAHGLAPQYSSFDTYFMTCMSIDEAVRNLVAVGSDPSRISLLDNFCWPDPIPSNKNPDAEHRMAQLVRSCQALYDISQIYETAFVSGKDSMKNNFIGKNQAGDEIQIAVDPTLLITSMGFVDDLDKSICSAFQNAGDQIYWIGQKPNTLLASEYAQVFMIDTDEKPNYDWQLAKELYQKVFQSIQAQLLVSCHDISEGGAMVALVESLIGSSLGAKIQMQDELFCFGESASSFIVSTDQPEKFEEHFAGHFLKLGEVTASDKLEWNQETLEKRELQKIWWEALENEF